MPDHYGTIAGYTAYHLARNHDIPVSDEDEILAALLVASEWLDARFRTQYGGYINNNSRDQIRDWPRESAYDVRLNLLLGIPREVDNATYEAAAISLATPGALSVNFTPGKYKAVSVDGAVSVTYASINSVAEAQAQFAIVNETIAPVLTGDGSARSSLVGQSVRW